MGLLPNVRITSQENITLTTQGSPSILALMGTAQWGAVDEVKLFSSFAQLLDYYKADADGLTIVKGADIAYGNGASVVKAVRVGSSAVKSSVGVDGDVGAEADVLTFSGLYEGEYGDNILVTIAEKGTGRTATVTDGVLTEQYSNNNATDGYSTNEAIAEAINGNSAFVSVVVKAGSETSNLVDEDSNVALIGGDNGTSGMTFATYTTAFDNVMNLEDFDVLVIPAETADADHITMVGKLDTRATSEKKFAMYVTGVAVDETIATQKARTSAGDRLVLCSPSIKYTPSHASVSSAFDGSYLACAVAGQIVRRDVETSVTRKELSIGELLVDDATSKQYYNNAEMEELLNAGVLPCSLITGTKKIARGVTRNTDKTSIYYEINIRRIVDYVSKLTYDRLDGFLGEPNLQRIRNTIAKEVDGILQQSKLDEVIAKYNPTEAVEGVSPDTIIVNMSIQPTFAVNFINVTLAVSRL